MKELEEMKKCFDEFMAKAEQTLVRMKGTAPKEILTKEEKEYLEAVIRPFRERVNFITKSQFNCWYYIKISINHIEENNIKDGFALPNFEKDKYYKGMELDKEYTLEELGLFKGEEV